MVWSISSTTESYEFKISFTPESYTFKAGKPLEKRSEAVENPLMFRTGGAGSVPDFKSLHVKFHKQMIARKY